MSPEPDPPAEGPEHRSEALSPVSPKPLHFPSPQNIPVLENQMDPVFNDTSNHPSTPPREERRHEAASPPQAPETIVDQDAAGEQAVHTPTTQQTADGSDSSEYSPEFVGSKSEDRLPLNASEPTAHPSAPSNTAPISQSVGPSHGSDPSLNEHENAIQPPTEPVQASLSPGNAGPIDIQSILDNLMASTPVSGASSTLAVASGISLQTPDTLQPVNTDASSQDASAPFSGLTAQNAIQGGDPSPTTNVGQHFTNYADLEQASKAGFAGPDALVLPPNSTAGAPGTSPGPDLIAPPSAANYLSLQSVSQAGATNGSDSRAQDEEVKWSPEIQKAYDGFLAAEREYVADGQWEKFPAGSRLFIGNLSSERVTKRDLFHVFHKHGRLAQISIKQAYGFIQFLTAEDCHRALDQEEGVAIRGRKIHLEISKPQKSTNRNRRRSRSPEHGRNARGTDSYRGGNSGQRDGRRRDDYRPDSRDAYRKRSPDHWPDRRRSRSPRERRWSANPDDDLPLPHRAPHEIPDLQILAKDEPDNQFLRYVEQSFTSRGVRANTLMLSPRLDETAVIRRQILEGVLAVMTLTRVNLSSQKYSLSLFDRSAGQNNVKFEEYNNLDLPICVELVVRAQKTHHAPTAPSYSQYGIPITPIQGPSPSIPPPYSHNQGQPPAGLNLSGLPLNSMDHTSLSQLLGSIQSSQASSGQPMSTQPPSQFNPADLSRFLGSVAPGGQQPPSFPPQYGQQQQAYPGQGYPSINQAPPQQQQQPQQRPPPSGGPDVQNIMAQLARYGR